MRPLIDYNNQCSLCQKNLGTIETPILCQSTKNPHPYHPSCLSNTYFFYNYFKETCCPDPSCKGSIKNNLSVESKIRSFADQKIFKHLKVLDKEETRRASLLFLNLAALLPLLILRTTNRPNQDQEIENQLKMLLAHQLSCVINKTPTFLLYSFITYYALPELSKTTLFIGSLTLPFINVFGKVYYASLYPKKPT